MWNSEYVTFHIFKSVLIYTELPSIYFISTGQEEQYLYILSYLPKVRKNTVSVYTELPSIYFHLNRSGRAVSVYTELPSTYFMSNFRKNAVSVYTDLPSIYFERKVQEECSIGICRLIFHIFQSVSVYTDLPSIYLCQYWYILTYFRAVSRRDRNQINKKGSLKYSRKYGREAHTYLPKFLYCNFSYYCIHYLKCMGWPEIISGTDELVPLGGVFPHARRAIPFCPPF